MDECGSRVSEVAKISKIHRVDVYSRLKDLGIKTRRLYRFGNWGNLTD